MAIQPNEILEVEESRVQALITKDLAYLATILGDDLTYIHSNGKVDGKAEVLAKLGTDFRYEEIRRGELAVRSYGDTAVLTGSMDVRFISSAGAASQSMSAMLTQVWVRQDASLVMTAYHVSRLEKS